MALPLGKLTILIGAGILGSVLAKEGRVSDVVSGALKIAWKQIKRSDQTPSAKKPPSDSLMAQMNSLRQELQMMASNRSVTIVTASRAGTTRYGVIIVVVVAGSGYFWWKGWKLPDMMFATKRSLSDACSSVSKELKNVYSSVKLTRRALSSKMDRLDQTLAESVEISTSTKNEVIELQGKTEGISTSFKNVRHTLESLETKLNRFEGEQAKLGGGVWTLCDFVFHNLQESPSIVFATVPELPPSSSSSMVTPPQSSRGLLEVSPRSPSRTESLPSVFESEGGRVGYNGFQQGNNGFLDAVGGSNSDEDRTPVVTGNVSSTSSRSRFPISSPSTVLRRALSATSGIVLKKRSSSEPSTDQKDESSEPSVQKEENW